MKWQIKNEEPELRKVICKRNINQYSCYHSKLTTRGLSLYQRQLSPPIPNIQSSLTSLRKAEVTQLTQVLQREAQSGGHMRNTKRKPKQIHFSRNACLSSFDVFSTPKYKWKIAPIQRRLMTSSITHQPSIANNSLVFRKMCKAFLLPTNYASGLWHEL